MLKNLQNFAKTFANLQKIAILAMQQYVTGNAKRIW